MADFVGIFGNQIQNLGQIQMVGLGGILFYRKQPNMKEIGHTHFFMVMVSTMGLVC